MTSIPRARWKVFCRSGFLPLLDRLTLSFQQDGLDHVKEVRELTRLAKKDQEECEYRLHLGFFGGILRSVEAGTCNPETLHLLRSLGKAVQEEGLLTHAIHGATSVFRIHLKTATK